MNVGDIVVLTLAIGIAFGIFIGWVIFGKDAIERIQNEYKDYTKYDPLFRGKSDHQYHYYAGNLNCADYIKHKCLPNRKAEREAKKAIKLMLNRCERKDGER